MSTLADMIRSYEQLKGGAMPSLHKFHKFIKTYDSDPQFQGGGLPGLMSLGSLANLNREVPGEFGFGPAFKVRQSNFASPALIARLNAALSSHPQREELNLPPIGDLLACGDAGCVYRTTGDEHQVYKIIPQRIQVEEYLNMNVYYTVAMFASEVAKTRSLGEANVGPALYNAFSLRVPLLPSERGSFDFGLGGEHMTVHVMRMAKLDVMMRPLNTGPAKGIDLERDGADTFARKRALIARAQEVLNCQLDVGDVEWGYFGARELGNLRIFDVDCLAPLPAEGEGEGEVEGEAEIEVEGENEVEVEGEDENDESDGSDIELSGFEYDPLHGSPLFKHARR
jgi:hypothetical protein